jgi:hypothetical protein
MISLAAFCLIITFAMSMMVMQSQARAWAAEVPRRMR